MPNNPNLIQWDAKGVPHSALFHDKYFCTQNGYEECCHVSAQGNHLKERFEALDSKTPGTFTIIETGFGTGLSFCCAWEWWEKFAPSTWSLHFISIELYPLSKEDIDRALENWPPLESYKKSLLCHYEINHSKVGVFDLKANIKLTIVFDEVVVSLKRIYEDKLAPNGADAWFLNGFSPFSNPLMWRPEVYKGMSLLSRPGTTLSTFTVAAAVRRGLEAEGFCVNKIPGYGTKKHVLSGYFL